MNNLWGDFHTIAKQMGDFDQKTNDFWFLIWSKTNECLKRLKEIQLHIFAWVLTMFLVKRFFEIKYGFECYRKLNLACVLAKQPINI